MKQKLAIYTRRSFLYYMYVDIDFTSKSLKIRSRHSKDRQYNGQQKKDNNKKHQQ